MRPLVLIAGGGTGGHVYPGLAVADALRSIADVDVIFVGTRRGLEITAVPKAGYGLEVLEARPMKGVGPKRAMMGAVIAARETLRSFQLVQSLGPRVVLSVGGYAAGPLSLAAALLGVELAVLEPNSVVGLTNRLLAPLASRAYVAWKSSSKVFRSGRARVLGAPLRGGFSPRAYAPKTGITRVVILGGSQGAQALNERLPAAMALAQRALPGLTVTVLHQAGRERDDVVRKAYEDARVEGAEVTAFVDDVSKEMEGADLLVARAGAATVAEIAAIGRPSILIPFPHATDDHQAKNAEALEEAGGAVAIRQEAASVERIAEEIVRILRDPALRTRMADAARRQGKPQAALDIARDLLQLGGIPVSPPKPRYVNGTTSAAGPEAH
jgi:UDP-N-acetylglucosamine--N-acetylmuramyl-(pentapeptide) pyrophosphoryl-undecaprenol N-acetylglucosamine transferase